MKYRRRERESYLVEEAGWAGVQDPVHWVGRIEAGLPIGEFEALRALLGLSVAEMAAKLGMSIATLSRRRAKRHPLDRDHSDRLMRYARLYWRSVELFDGDRETGRNWLLRPARALGGRRPLDFAETEMGAREVEDLLGRLEHGVYV